MVWKTHQVKVVFHSWNSALFCVLPALLKEWVAKYLVLPLHFSSCVGEQDHLCLFFFSTDYKNILIQWLKLRNPRYKSPMNANDPSKYPVCSFLFWMDIVLWPLQLSNCLWKRNLIETRCPTLLVLVKTQWWTAICLPSKSLLDNLNLC